MITAAPYALQFDVSGLAGIEQQIHSRIEESVPSGEIAFEVQAGGDRGGGKNAMIMAVQAARGRNAAWVNEKTKKQIVDTARGLYDKSRSVRAQAENTIKQLLLISIGENVQAQKNPGGSRFTALTANYAAFKRRKFGFVTPILRATGDLLGGLKVRVSRT